MEKQRAITADDLVIGDKKIYDAVVPQSNILILAQN